MNPRRPRRVYVLRRQLLKRDKCDVNRSILNGLLTCAQRECSQPYFQLTNSRREGWPVYSSFNILPRLSFGGTLNRAPVKLAPLEQGNERERDVYGALKVK